MNKSGNGNYIAKSENTITVECLSPNFLPLSSGEAEVLIQYDYCLKLYKGMDGQP
jgi:hypothetical protein